MGTMKAFIILAVAAIGSAAPAADPQLLQSGLPAGPLTPAWGDPVATPRGARPLHLEGFSEDVNQDGFVDPIGQAAVAIAAPAVYAHHALPALTYALPTVKAVEVKAPEPVEVKAPVVTYAGLPYAHAYAHAPVACSFSCTHSSYSYLHRTHHSHRNCTCRYPCCYQRPSPCLWSWILRRNPWRTPSCSCCQAR